MRPDQPVFTIVIATFDRGALIGATLESVAAQSFRDYEVLVVSDGPAVDGLAETVRRFGDQFSLHQLETRTRSQSGPNNHGWAAARGRYVAYLGHDDIWHPQHLEKLAEALDSDPGISFAVSGCIFFGPEGAGENYTWVTGIFDSRDTSIPRDHFFPPSSIAHRRDLPDSVPRWPDAADTGDPVDVALLKGAVAAGMRFASTRVVTVFKFASAQRYLSYLYPDDREQREMLERLSDPADLSAFVTDVVARARRNGTFMHLRYSEAEPAAPGETMRKNERARGIAVLPLVPLTDRLWLEAGDDPRGLDWYPAESYQGNPARWRWSGPSTSPRLRIPVTAAAPVRFVVHIGAFTSDQARGTLDVLVNRSPVPFELVDDPEIDTVRLGFVAPLYSDRESMVEFRLAEGGFCLLGVGLEPDGVAPSRPGPGLDLVVRDRALAQRDEARSEVARVLNSRTWRYSAGIRSLRRRRRRE